VDEKSEQLGRGSFDSRRMKNRQDAKVAKDLFGRGSLVEPSEEVDLLARRVIGAAIEVHRHLGPGFLESAYQRAMAVELTLQQIPFEIEYPVLTQYKDQVVVEQRLDLLVGGDLVVEIKAVETLTPIHTAQVLSYLKAGDFQLGLLINFNVSLLKEGVRRLIWS
jgi:GxxExxY protein